MAQTGSIKAMGYRGYAWVEPDDVLDVSRRDGIPVGGGFWSSTGLARLCAARLRSEWRDHGEFEQQTHQASWPRRPLSEKSAERVARLMEEIGGSWSGWHGSRLRCQIPLFGERGQDKGAPHPQGLRRAIPHGSGGLHIKSIDAEYSFRFERVSVTHVFELRSRVPTEHPSGPLALSRSM